MEVLAAQVINGLSLGSIYVLLVTAFNLLLLVAMIVHFSFPQVVVFSMYAAWIALKFTGGSFLAACAAAVGVSIAINCISAPLFRKVSGNRGEVDINSTMVMSLGIGMILTEALSHGFNSGRPVSFGDAIPLGAPLLRVGLIVFLDSQLCVIAVATLAVIAFFLLLYRSGAGRAFRAIAEDPVGARLAGIPIRRTGMASFALAGVMGGVTAVLMAMLLGSAFPRLGEQVALKVLAISIIAGMGHLAGGLAVGLLLGILEAVVQGYVGGSWSNAIAFAALLAVMLTRPKGLFGSRV